MSDSPDRRFPRPALGPLLGVVAVLAMIALAMSEAERLIGLLRDIESMVDRKPLQAMLVYVAAFVVLATLALPIGSLFCLAAGYLFGTWTGAAAALIGGTLAALLTFVLARYLIGHPLHDRLYASRARKLLTLLERNAFYYLVLLRIVPVAPFFVVNAAAGLTRTTTLFYTFATVLGLIPTAIIYSAVGAGLGSLLEARELAGPALLLEPRIALPLLALVLLILGTWAARRWLLSLRDDEC